MKKLMFLMVFLLSGNQTNAERGAYLVLLMA